MNGCSDRCLCNQAPVHLLIHCLFICNLPKIHHLLGLPFCLSALQPLGSTFCRFYIPSCLWIFHPFFSLGHSILVQSYSLLRSQTPYYHIYCTRTAGPTALSTWHTWIPLLDWYSLASLTCKSFRVVVVPTILIVVSLLLSRVPST